MAVKREKKCNGTLRVLCQNFTVVTFAPFWYIYSRRAGNSLSGFPSESLVFCPKMSDLSDSLTLLTKKEEMSDLFFFSTIFLNYI